MSCAFVAVRVSRWSLGNVAWKPSRVVSRFVRKVRTSSGAVAVQIVTRRGRAVEQVEHLGSAGTDAELALLLSAARDRLSPGRAGSGRAARGSASPRQQRSGVFIKKIVQTLRTARSATIAINGQRMPPELTDPARTMLDRLETGH